MLEMAPQSSVSLAFQEFQTELDSRHNKYERLVKISRDVTIDSKRIIFQLQRIPGCTVETHDEILHEARIKLDEVINNKLYMVASELLREDPYQYIRAYSPGLQEYIEAESLYHYMKGTSFISHSDVCRSLTFEKCDKETKTINTLSVCVPFIEFLLGFADVTGEIMRLAVTYVGKGDLVRPYELCSTLRVIHDTFKSINFYSHELWRKIEVLYNSLMKVENVCYSLHIRGSEVPRRSLVDMFNSNEQGAEALNGFL